MNPEHLVETYFRAEEAGDSAAVVAICGTEVVVRNAANPPQYGHAGVRAYVEDFRDRTEARRFTVLSIAVNVDVIYARWQADIVFRRGASFGPVVARRSFRLELQGVCRFKLDGEGHVVELDVFHETTTALNLAIKTSKV